MTWLLADLAHDRTADRVGSVLGRLALAPRQLLLQFLKLLLQFILRKVSNRPDAI